MFNASHVFSFVAGLEYVKEKRPLNNLYGKRKDEVIRDRIEKFFFFAAAESWVWFKGRGPRGRRDEDEVETSSSISPPVIEIRVIFAAHELHVQLTVIGREKEE